MRIYLADLGHNQLTISSDTYPLGIANLACYLEEYLDGREALELRLFREPQALKEALDRQAPDILGLSSYSWNHNLSLTFARYAKGRDPAVLTVMGGPNFPLTRAEQQSFLRSMPEVDVASRGPTYEAERAILQLVRRYQEVGRSRDDLFSEPIPGNAWIDRRTGEMVFGEEVPRIVDLDEIPSPYIRGYMDEYLTTGYFPLLQISRGCPFTCTFCNSAVEGNNRVFRHSAENVQRDLLYLAERAKPEAPLCLADDNFGMYPWDEEIAAYIHHLQERYGWPKYIRTTTGKNRGDRIVRVMRKVRGSLPMTAAVQSLNPVVLKNIRRDNISLDTYSEIQREVQSQGMQGYGELILCLPGETRESILDALDRLLGTGVQRISMHQLMLLHGAPLATAESRRRFGFGTRFRVVARNISRYLEEPVVETEEIVVETPDFSFQDYLDLRLFHLLLTVFFYEGNFEEAFRFAEQAGATPFEVITALFDNVDRAPRAFREVLDDFLRESQEELFETEAECVEWSLENFDRLVSGEAGGNLLSKYSMLGRFFVLPEALEFLELGITEALGGSLDAADREALESVMAYLRNLILHEPFAESLERSPRWHAAHDVDGWREEGYARPLNEHAFPEPRRLAAAVSQDVNSLLRNRLETFGEHPQGLGKFTRTMFARDLRRTIISSPAAQRDWSV